MKRRLLSLLAASAVCLSLLAASCGGDAAQTCAADWPEAEGDAIHVAAACPSDAPDGSQGKPYVTVSEALAAAEPGATILVAEGTYPEALRIEVSDVTVVAAPAVSLQLDAVEAEAGVLIDGVDGVHLEGLRVVSAPTAGVWVASGGATLEGLTIEGTRPSPAGPFGYGVLATSPTSLAVTGCTVTGSAVTGVLVTAPQAAVSVEDSQVSGNGLGGIRLEAAAHGASVQGNTVSDNASFGIAVMSGAGVTVHDNTVTNTVAASGSGAADGLVVAELVDGDGVSLGPADVSVEANEVSGSGRAGMILSGEVYGIILQNLVASNGTAGIWAQRGAGNGQPLQIEDNEVTDNVLLGVALAAGTRATVAANTISGTQPGSTIDPVTLSTISMGDGLGVFAGSAATITDNTFSANSRAGVLGDGLVAEDSSFSGNTYSDNGVVGIILQNLGPAPKPPTEIEAQVLDAADAVSVLGECNDEAGLAVVGASNPAVRTD